MGFPGGSDSEESTCNAGEIGLILGLGKSPWRREWQPTPVFLPRESHEWRSLVGYNSWGLKNSDTTKCIHTEDLSSDSEYQNNSVNSTCLCFF